MAATALLKGKKQRNSLRYMAQFSKEMDGSPR